MNLRKCYVLANKKRDTSWFFILNSLHFIVSSGDYYCHCQNNHKCKIRKILVILSDFKMGIDKYLFDYNFLSWYYIKLVKEPIPIFYEKNAFRTSSNFVAMIGTLVNIGIYLCVKAFIEVKKFIWVGLNEKTAYTSRFS